MTLWKEVQGSQLVKPLELDTISSQGTVYQRRNIEQITVENNGNPITMWQYEERSMTTAEYEELLREEQQAKAESVAAAASIAFVTMAESGTIDSVTAGEHLELFAEWAYPVDFKPGQLRRDPLDGCLYQVNDGKGHTSQEGWPPSLTPDLWHKASDPAEEWPDWSQPIGAHDAYDEGDKTTHNEKRWISDCNDNVWEPGVFGWTEYVEETTE